MKRKILITGGHGMLASDATVQLSNIGRFDVSARVHSDVDVTRPEDVRGALVAFKPDIVIHTAAVHVDPCEEDPALAFQVNAWATRSLARACQQQGSILVYISTCGLFGDELKAYTEYDPVALKTVYARSKYEGEVFVRQFCERHFIVRPGWLFGGNVEHAKNFVVRRYEEALKASVVKSVVDKYGSPTYTTDLVLGIAKLLETDEYGIYHISNVGGCTRAAYVRHIIQSFGLSTRVEEVDSSYYPRRANVPDCEILEQLNLRFIGLDLLPPWEEAVERYIRKIRTELVGP